MLRLQRCCWGGYRCSCALLRKRLLRQLLFCRRRNRNWRLHLWSQLSLWRCWSLSLRRVHSLWLWSRRHCLGDSGGSSSKCCLWWCWWLLLLRYQTWGCMMRCRSTTWYWRRRISMQSRLWNRGAVNVTTLRTWSHHRWVHRTGRARHLCLGRKIRPINIWTNDPGHQQLQDGGSNLTLNMTSLSLSPFPPVNTKGKKGAESTVAVVLEIVGLLCSGWEGALAPPIPSKELSGKSNCPLQTTQMWA